MKIRDLNDNDFSVQITNEHKDIISFDFYADGKNCESVELTPEGQFRILTEYFEGITK